MECEDRREIIGDLMNNSEDRDEISIQEAVQYLKCSPEKSEGSSLWDVLCSLVDKLLCERPRDAYDMLENIIRSLKTEKTLQYLRDVPISQIALEHAKVLQELSTPDPKDEEWMKRPAQPSPWSEVLEQMTLLKRVAGVMMPDTLVLRLALSVRRLLQANPDIIRARFWGRVAGCYLVLEAELSEEGYTTRREEMQAALDEELLEQKERAIEEELRAAEAAESGEEPPPEDSVVQAVQAVPPPQQPPVPAEPSGTGVNRLVYLVSREPAGPESWRRLPDVSPQQISAARQGLSLFSGHLAAPVRTWPKFPGDEASLLRAQVARISAATHVAPAGFFKVRRKRTPSELENEDENEDEEEEEEEEDDDEPVEREVVANPRYVAPPPGSLLELSTWVHYTPHILQQQARTAWWNPNPDNEDEDEEEVSGSEASGPRGPGPEVGPRPLALLSEDRAEPELAPGFPACFALRPAASVGPGAVVARSLLWPGAFTLAIGRRLEHVYIGQGLKASSHHHVPPPPPQAAVETPELTFAMEPTPAEEAEAARLAAPSEEEGEEGEESEED